MSWDYLQNVVKIQNSAWIYPHDNDTGGFYIALIRKNKNLKEENVKGKD